MFAFSAPSGARRVPDGAAGIHGAGTQRDLGFFAVSKEREAVEASAWADFLDMKGS